MSNDIHKRSKIVDQTDAAQQTFDPRHHFINGKPDLQTIFRVVGIGIFDGQVGQPVVMLEGVGHRGTHARTRNVQKQPESRPESKGLGDQPTLPKRMATFGEMNIRFAAGLRTEFLDQVLWRNGCGAKFCVKFASFGLEEEFDAKKASSSKGLAIRSFRFDVPPQRTFAVIDAKHRLKTRWPGQIGGRFL